MLLKLNFETHEDELFDKNVKPVAPFYFSIHVKLRTFLNTKIVKVDLFQTDLATHFPSATHCVIGQDTVLSFCIQIYRIT